MTLGLLTRPIPSKPAAFTADGAPAAVEVKFVEFWRDRPVMVEPARSLLVHTNGATKEGSVDSAWNWAHADPNRNTIPHYQIDRTHGGVVRARKMLPSNRVGIANATVMPSSSVWATLTATERAAISAHGQIRLWSLAIETADLGWPNPGGTAGFDVLQADLLAECIAYESIVHGFPITILSSYWGPGVGAHTDPFGFPFTTTARGKPCPGDEKKRELRAEVFPRAVQIRDAWTGAPVVVDPPSFEEDEEMAYLFRLANGDYGIRGAAGSRRVSGEEFDSGLIPPREQAKHVPPGSNLEWWILRELDAYDRSVNAS